MMWYTVLGEDGLFENMVALTRPELIKREPANKNSAQIINIKPNTGKKTDRKCPKYHCTGREFQINSPALAGK